MYLEVEDRHQSVKDIAQFFEADHLSEPMRGVSEAVADAVQEVLDIIHEDSSELTTGIRRMLEAKDCFVRAVLVQTRSKAIELELEDQV